MVLDKLQKKWDKEKEDKLEVRVFSGVEMNFGRKLKIQMKI